LAIAHGCTAFLPKSLASHDLADKRDATLRCVLVGEPRLAPTAFDVKQSGDGGRRRSVPPDPDPKAR